MKPIFFLTLCIFVFTKCTRPEAIQSSGRILVKVKNKTLTKEEIESLMPDNISPSDSMIMLESIVKKWAVDLLMDDLAYKNIAGDKAEIDKLVDEYRRSLMRHHYQERVVAEKISTVISRSEQKAYYEKYKQQFVLNENLIKGLLLKIPVGAPGLNNVRKWYTSNSTEALEQIEKYSLQNAITYDYFYDRWVNFDEVLIKIPQRMSDPTLFLKRRNSLETSDSTHVYFLNISNKLLAGSLAPFDYAAEQIKTILLNKRKIEYLKKFEDNLYRKAVEDGIVKFNTK